MLKRIDFNGNPHIGVYCKANNDIIFIQPSIPKKDKTEIEKTLNVRVVELTIGGSAVVGSLMAINSNGAVITDFIEENELAIMEKNFKGEILVIDDKFNAAGNNILANDYGAIVHPMMKDETIIKIKEVLDVEVKRGTIAEINTVGMAAVATNKGVLCHPKIKEKEKKLIEDTLGVEAKIGTVNHGMPYIGAGVVANIYGAIASINTTGIELGRIEDALNLIGGRDESL